MQVRKQQLELDMEQQTDSKQEKEYIKTVYCHPAYLTSMQSTSWETLDWKAQAGIKIAGRNINNLRYVDGTTLMAESEEELKSLLIKMKEKSEKVGLKLSIEKMNIKAWLGAMILVLWMLSFKPDFSLNSFTFIKRLFSSSSLFSIRVMSSAYLRLLIILLAILIPACASSSPAFLMMYSA